MGEVAKASAVTSVSQPVSTDLAAGQSSTSSTRYVDDQVGCRERVETHLAVVADLGNHQIRDRVARGIVEVRRIGPRTATGEHGDERVALRLRHGDVQDDRCRTADHAASADDYELGDRVTVPTVAAGRASASCSERSKEQPHWTQESVAQRISFGVCALRSLPYSQVG